MGKNDADYEVVARTLSMALMHIRGMRDEADVPAGPALKGMPELAGDRDSLYRSLKKVEEARTAIITMHKAGVTDMGTERHIRDLLRHAADAVRYVGRAWHGQGDLKAKMNEAELKQGREMKEMAGDAYKATHTAISWLVYLS